MTMPDADPPPVTYRGGLIRKLPILVIVAAAVAGAFLLRDKLSFAALAEHREILLAFRDEHYFWSSMAFIAAYVGIVAFSLPGATVATLTGGFLFGLFPGTIFNVGAATVGAVAIFLAARAGFGAAVAARLQAGGGAAARLMAALRDNEWSVLLTMRLVPVVPFFVANLVPAFAGVRADRFAITTFFGIMPGALVFTSVGAGLGEVFAAGQTPDLKVIFAPHVLLPILGLALLSALPILRKAFRKG
ncbi:MAG: TVP38/TMEM64 family protein [Gemmobacter sp.]